MHWNTAISPMAVAIAFAFSAAVGLFFGIWPARRASQAGPHHRTSIRVERRHRYEPAMCLWWAVALPGLAAAGRLSAAGRRSRYSRPGGWAAGYGPDKPIATGHPIELGAEFIQGDLPDVVELRCKVVD